MKKLILFLLLAGSAWAQTTVTGTVIDPNNNPYANGTVSAYSLTASGQPSITVSAVPTTSAGAFTIIAPVAGTYVFTICAPPTLLNVPTTNPTPPQVCFTSAPIAISGPSQGITSLLTPVVLGPKGSSGSGGGAVSSVFGRTGGVVAVSGDYQFNQIGGSLALSQFPNGVQTNGLTTVGILPVFTTNAQTLGNSLWSDNGVSSLYSGAAVGVGAGDPSCGSAVGCLAMGEGSLEGAPQAGHDYIRADTVIFGHALVASVNNDGPLLMVRATNSGALGQPLLSNGNGTGTFADPNISVSTVPLFTAQSATGLATSPATNNPLRGGAGGLTISGTGITGGSGCSIQLFYSQAGSGATDTVPFATVFFTPQNPKQNQPVTPSSTAGAFGDNVVATYNCTTFPTAGSLTVTFNGGLPTTTSGTPQQTNLTQIGGNAILSNSVIAHDPSQTSTCAAQSSTGTNTVTLSGLVINANDTVMVGIANSVANATNTVSDSASNTYTLLVNKVGSTGIGVAVYGSAASGAAAATSVTVTTNTNQKFVACVSTYTGVTKFGGTSSGSGSSNQVSNSIIISDPGNFIFMMGGQASVNTFSQVVGSLLNQAQTTATTPASGAICDNTGNAAQSSVNCTMNESGTANQATAVVELRSASSGNAVMPSQLIPNQVQLFTPLNVSTVVNSTGAAAEPTFCDNQKSIASLSTINATQELAINGSTAYYICGFYVTTSVTTANTVKLVYGTGTNCATGQTDLTLSIPLIATATAEDRAFISYPYPIITPAGQAVCANLSAATAVSIQLVYANH